MPSSTCERLDEFRKGSTVGPEELRDPGFVKKRGRVKVLGEGELTKELDRAGPCLQRRAPSRRSRPPAAGRGHRMNGRPKYHVPRTACQVPGRSN